MLDSQIIRKKTIRLSCETGAGHLAPSLSCIEILTVLFNDFLKYDCNNAKSSSRDRLIFSKGHGAYGYYIILNELGFLPDFEIKNFYQDNSTIKGCLTLNHDYMIEASTGSLGHGLPISVGMALSFKMQKLPNKVICVVGDGEMQEGSNFEALNLAYRFKLDNLLVIIDANQLQAMDKVEDISYSNKQLSKILSSFTENFKSIDGHNISELKDSYNDFFNHTHDSFSILVCNTIKGKGVDICENSIAHHFRCPTEDGYIIGDSDE